VIRNYNAHAANERTFLAWVRTGLSSVALGTVIKKGSLVAVVVASASSTQVSSSAQSSLSSYGGSVLVGIGIAVVAGAAARFVRTARRIDSRAEHAVGIVRFSSAFSRVVSWAPERSADFRRKPVRRSSVSGRNGLFGRVEQHDPKFANGRLLGSSKN
jgi:putative membrane protein